MSTHALLGRPAAPRTATTRKPEGARRKPDSGRRPGNPGQSDDRALCGRNDAAPAGVQTKLVVGSANDPLEKEADAVAERITNSQESQRDGVAFVGAASMPALQRKCAECAGDGEKETVQRTCITCAEEADEQLVQAAADGRSSPARRELRPDIAARIALHRHHGARLPDSTRGVFEARLGHDLSNTRIHDGSAAASLSRELGARAFTVGRDIFFGQGEYQPARPEGRRLLAHELVHTIQQGVGRRDRVQRAPARASGPALEDEFTAEDQDLLEAQRDAEKRGARLIEKGLELKQGQLDVRRLKSDLCCNQEPNLNVRVARVSGDLVPTAEARTYANFDEEIQDIASHASASVSLIAPTKATRIIQTESPIDWSLKWFCPQARDSGFTVEEGGKSGLAWATATGTSGKETGTQEIATDSDKAGGQLVQHGKSKVLQDVHNYGYDTALARALLGRAQARGFDPRRCGYVLEQQFNATVGAFEGDTKLFSRCYYSFNYRAERDGLTGVITVSVQYKGVDELVGSFKESGSGGAAPSSKASGE